MTIKFYLCLLVLLMGRIPSNTKMVMNRKRNDGHKKIKGDWHKKALYHKISMTINHACSVNYFKEHFVLMVTERNTRT